MTWQIILWILVGVAAVYIIVPTVIVYNMALKRSKHKKAVFARNRNPNDERDEQVTREETKNRAWLAEQPLETRKITSFDGLTLVARELLAEKPTNMWIVAIHGFGSEGLHLGTVSRHFHDAGYNVLLPDLRCFGSSQGKYIGMGWLDAIDIRCWISMLLEEHEDAQIALHGGSMGGATVMMTTGWPLPRCVYAAIEDCGYCSVWHEYKYQLRKKFHLPVFPDMYLADAVAKLNAHYGFWQASSTKQLKKSVTPTLFIHGTEDPFVPFWMLERNYNACTAQKEKLTVKGAGHNDSMEWAPELYWSTCDAFLTRCHNLYTKHLGGLG